MDEVQRMGDSLAERLSRLLESIRRETRLPGIGVVIELGGRRIAVATGVRVLDEPDPITVDSHFHIGCLAKLLGSLVVLELARDRRLDLNAPIEEYLTELRGTVHGRSVALVHLLSHTSGYQGTELAEPATRSFNWDRLVEYLVSAPQFFTPGAVFNYEHTGAILVGEIVRRVTNARVDDLIREAIFASLGISPGEVRGDQHASAVHVGQHEAMRNGSCRRTGWSAYYEPEFMPFPEFWRAAFSYYSLSLSDIAKLGSALMGAADADVRERSTISLASRMQIQRPVVRLPPMLEGTGGEAVPRAFGLAAGEYRGGWFGLDVASIGQCVSMRLHPQQLASVAVGINVFAPRLRDLIMACVCGLLQVDSSQPRVNHPFELDLADLEGHYVGNGSRECDARLVDDCLQCEFGMRGSDSKVRTELVLDDDRGAVARTSVPGSGLGFFRVPGSTDIGLMSGYVAYKKVAAPQGRSRRAA